MEPEGSFRSLFDDLPIACHELDRDGFIRRVNRMECALLGFSEEELVGRQVWTLVDPELKEVSHNAVLAKLRGETPLVPFERPFQTRDGRLLILEVHESLLRNRFGEVEGIRSLMLDVTRRREAENASRQSEARMRALLSAMPDLMFRISRAGIYLDYFAENPASLLVSPEKFLGASVRDIGMPPELTDAGLRAIEETLDTGLVQQFEYPLSIRGEVRQFEARFAPCGHDEALVIVRDITPRRAAEEALRESQERLRNLTGGLMNGQEWERQRLSRELHDDINQKLAMIIVDLELVERELSGSKKVTRSAIRTIRDRAVQLSEDVRRTAYQLHPSILEHLGLVVALESLCRSFSGQEEVEVAFSSVDIGDSVPDDVALCLYRVAQESLHNIARHSGSGQAEMSLDRDGDGIRLTVADHGRGFDPDSTEPHAGLGIISMQERARLVNGRFTLTTNPGKGVQVELWIPLPASGDPEEQRRSLEELTA